MSWIAIVIICLVFGAIIGNLSLLKRSARPMRKGSLNDLKPTIKGSEDLTKAPKNNTESKSDG